jgi:O-antigen/teichoic acid export membrane protein
MGPRKIVEFSLGPVGGALLALVTLPLMTWIYSAEDIGRISMLQVTNSFCILLFGLGLDQTYVREYHQSLDKVQLLRVCLFPGLGFFGLVVLVMLLGPWSISSILFDISGGIFTLLIVLCLVVGFCSSFLSLVLRMQERAFEYSLSQVIPKFLMFVMLCLVSVFTGLRDFLELLTFYSLSALSVFIFFTWRTRGEWLGVFSKKVEFLNYASALKFGMPLVASGVAYWGMQAVDRIFLRFFSTLDQLGVYSVAASFAGVAIIFQSIFSTVWAPVVYKWSAAGEDVAKISKFLDSITVVVIFAFVSVGMFSGLLEFILPQKYSSVKYLVVACVSGPLFYTLSEVTGIGVTIIRKTSYSIYASVASMLTNLILCYCLIPAYGAAGAAGSTAFSFWIFFVCRTELSCLLWERIPRLKLYCFTFLCMALAIATAVGVFNALLTVIFWGGVGLLSGFIYKNQVLLFMRYVCGRLIR